MLDAGVPDVWDALTRHFEAALIRVALGVTAGVAASRRRKVGIGRNTITRRPGTGVDD